MARFIDTCGNCEANLYDVQTILNDEKSELHFCDVQCFREWAEDKGAEKVIAFYRSMNVNSATY